MKDAEVQAILISDDNLMANNCSALVGLGINNSIPVLGTNVTNAADGALACLSIDYDELCLSTADVVISVIRGQNPDELPIKYFDTKISAVNKNSAEQLGITLPEEILENANYIFE